MGSEEAKEKAEFGRGKRKRGPSTKQREAAEARETAAATALAQQKEAAERRKPEKAPAKSAVESAELSNGTVGSEFKLHHPNSASSAKQKANEPPEQTAQSKTGKDKKEHDKYCHFCQVWPTARAFPGEPALL